MINPHSYSNAQISWVSQVEQAKLSTSIVKRTKMICRQKLAGRGLYHLGKEKLVGSRGEKHSREANLLKMGPTQTIPEKYPHVIYQMKVNLLYKQLGNSLFNTILI